MGKNDIDSSALTDDALRDETRDAIPGESVGLPDDVNAYGEHIPRSGYTPVLHAPTFDDSLPLSELVTEVEPVDVPVMVDSPVEALEKVIDELEGHPDGLMRPSVIDSSASDGVHDDSEARATGDHGATPAIGSDTEEAAGEVEAPTEADAMAFTVVEDEAAEELAEDVSADMDAAGDADAADESSGLSDEVAAGEQPVTSDEPAEEASDVSSQAAAEDSPAAPERAASSAPMADGAAQPSRGVSGKVVAVLVAIIIVLLIVILVLLRG
jgi:hypothetical protein